MKLYQIAIGLVCLGLTACPPPPPPADDRDAVTEQPSEFDASASADKTPATPQEVERVQELLNKILQNKVFFDFDKSTLTEEGKKILSEVGSIMTTGTIGKKISVEIGGHTDAVGTEEYNMALGEKRAQAVMEYLESYGVESGRITIRSFGEEMPAATGSDSDSNAQNRRAEFKATATVKD